ncbi:expressed protein [Echinococcus multilocularis]|uniref:Expressed protein n=1 Tax=Echinococcus multilocularis TaxID=6211 RepID=A0A087VY74_ECHMU|nr:expressed protein [Echinococcus multilocularis]
MFDVARSLKAGPVPSHPPGLNFEGGREGEEKGQVGMKRRKTSTMNACALRAKPFTSISSQSSLLASNLGSFPSEVRDG